MQLRLRAPANDPEELLQATLKFYGEQKTMPDLQAEFYAIQQNDRESEDYFFHLYAIYEKIIHQQWEQGLLVMAEKTVWDSVISQLQDVTIQKFLEEKVIDNPELSVLAASDNALR